MGRQSTIFDVINKSDEKIDEFLKHILKEIKNLKYLRTCLFRHRENEKSDMVREEVNRALTNLDSANYWVCLVGFCFETSKSNNFESKDGLERWSKMNDIDMGSLSGHVIGYEEISEAIRKGEERLKNRVMNSAFDNIHKIDEARRLLGMYFVSSNLAKEGTRIVALKKMTDDI